MHIRELTLEKAYHLVLGSFSYKKEKREEINFRSSEHYSVMETPKSIEDIVSVDAHAARDLLRSGYQYLDVRMREDFEKGHVEGARNVPFYASVTPQGKVKNEHFIEQVESVYGKEEHFIVGCRTGVRSKLATVDLLNAGFKNVKNMGGGYLSWVKSMNEDA